jgi:hypothetical protein
MQGSPGSKKKQMYCAQVARMWDCTHTVQPSSQPTQFGIEQKRDRPLTASRGQEGLIQGYQTQIIASPSLAARRLVS